MSTSPMEVESAPTPNKQRPASNKSPEPEEKARDVTDLVPYKTANAKDKKNMDASKWESAQKLSPNSIEPRQSVDTGVAPSSTLSSITLKDNEQSKPAASESTSNNAAEESGVIDIPNDKYVNEGSTIKSVVAPIAKDKDVENSNDASLSETKKNAMKVIDAEKSDSLENVGSFIEKKDSNEGYKDSEHKSQRPSNEMPREETNEPPAVTENGDNSKDDGWQGKQAANRNGKRAGRKPQQKIAGKEVRPIGDNRGKKRRKEKEDGRKTKKNETKEDVEDWVQCEKCEKWRLIPSVKNLPDKWYCKMNKTDTKRNFCEAH